MCGYVPILLHASIERRDANCVTPDVVCLVTYDKLVVLYKVFSGKLFSGGIPYKRLYHGRVSHIRLSHRNLFHGKVSHGTVIV
jgi:hypothetical protein